MNLFRKSNIKWLVMALVLLTAIFLFIYRILPYSEEDIRNSIVDAEHRYSYVIRQGDTPLLYFEGVTEDSAFVGLNDKGLKVTERSLGCWINSSFIVPSCKGRIATVFGRCDSTLLDTAFIRRIINEEITTNENTLAAFGHARLEMNYYLDTHGYNDEGYTDVVRYRDSLDVEKENIEHITAMLKKAADGNSLSVGYDEEYTVRYQNITRECLYVRNDNPRGNTLLQLTDSITPDNVTPLNLWNLTPMNLNKMKETVFIVGRSYYNEHDMMSRNIEYIHEDVRGDTLTTLPRLNIMKGSPVFTRGGIFLGILGGDTIIHRNIIRKSL